MNKTNIQFRRKREKRTDYRRRLKLLLSKKPRLVIRKSIKSTTAQIINYTPEGDKVAASANSKSLAKLGWNQNTGNIPAAYLTGLMLGKKAKKAGIKEAVLDMGFTSSTKGSRIYAALKGVVDSGINVPTSQENLPDEKRIRGEHITSYEKQNPKNFTKTKPETLKEDFEKVRRAIEENG